MTRWGKFRPFILWFSLPLLLMNLLCFAVPDFSSDGAKIAWGYVSYALLGSLYSLVNIPFGSLAGAMTQEWSATRSASSGSRRSSARSATAASPPRTRAVELGRSASQPPRPGRSSRCSSKYGAGAARVAAEAGITVEHPAQRQAIEDQIRAEMSQQLYHWDPRDPSRYDLVVNTSRVDLQTAVDMIVAASRR